MTPHDRARRIAERFIGLTYGSGYVKVGGYGCGHVHQAIPEMVRDNMRAELTELIADAIRRDRATDRRSRARRKARRT